MVFVNIELARRLEAIETWCAAEYGRARLAMHPDSDTSVVSVAGGVACFLGPGSPLNESRGLGMLGPVSSDDLDAMERPFLGRGVTSKVTACPLADPSLLEGLAARGYRASAFEDVLYRTLDASERFPEPPRDIVVSWARPDEAEVYGQTMIRGFAAPEEPDPSLRELFLMSAKVEGMLGQLARVEGEPAGAAALLIRDGMAMLCGASTLPIYRNRGVQTALLHARLAQASKLGCEIVVIGAAPGSTSHRNAERQGFRVAYTKLALVRDPS
jgi:GNAT superfamily N-acetyltransferase